MTKKKKVKTSDNIKFLDFLLKYWPIVAGIITGLFVLFQFLYSSKKNTEEIQQIRNNYQQVLDISSQIIAKLSQGQKIDSLTIEFEIAYGKFIPFKNDKTTFKYLRDFRIEIYDFNNNRSNIEKLSYRQRCLLKAISDEFEQLQ